MQRDNARGHRIAHHGLLSMGAPDRHPPGIPHHPLVKIASSLQIIKLINNLPPLAICQSIGLCAAGGKVLRVPGRGL